MKTQRSPSMPYVLVFGGVWLFMTIGALIAYPPENIFYGFIYALVVASVVGWHILVPLFEIERKKQSRMTDDLKTVLLSQYEVDQKLSRVARDLTSLWAKQVQYQGAETYPKVLRDNLEEQISTTKSAFWKMHKLATDLGYLTRSKVSDYESIPLWLFISDDTH